MPKIRNNNSSPPDARASAPKGRKRKKRGRPKSKKWWLTDKYLRSHCKKRLRRTEVINLRDADLHATRTKRRLTTFVTIRWALTEREEDRINTRWSALLNSLRIWASRQGIEIAHIWVHENPPHDIPAFNTHMLVNIPEHLHEAAEKWLMKTLRGTVGAVDIQPRVCPGWENPEKRRSYMSKGTDWATANMFHLITEKGWDFNQGEIEFKRSGTSRNINARARDEWRRSAISKMDAQRFPDKYARAKDRAA